MTLTNYFLCIIVQEKIIYYVTLWTDVGKFACFKFYHLVQQPIILSFKILHYFQPQILKGMKHQFVQVVFIKFVRSLQLIRTFTTLTTTITIIIV